METGFYIDSMRRRMLPMSLGVQSPGGVLTQNVQPGQATQATPSLPRSMEIRRKIAELEGSQAEDDGGMSTLNALAAQFAGESFAPIQAQYLKRASASSPQARTQAQLARLMREAEIADRFESQQQLQADRLAEQRQIAEANRQTAADRRASEEQLRRELAAQSDATRRFLASQSDATRRELAAARASEAGKAPTGYRYTTEGNLQAIPGGPADVKYQAEQQRKAEGGTDVEVALSSLRNAYDRLEQGGGITSTKQGPLSNLPASLSSSGVGQAVGRALGTSNQSARNDIAMSRPALLAALMKATGMNAKQMDSNAELKLWMTTATDPTLDVEANRRALDNIERKYLSGRGLSPAPAQSGGGGLTPAEQAELEQLRKSLNRKPGER